MTNTSRLAQLHAERPYSTNTDVNAVVPMETVPGKMIRMRGRASEWCSREMLEIDP